MPKKYLGKLQIYTTTGVVVVVVVVVVVFSLCYVWYLVCVMCSMQPRPAQARVGRFEGVSIKGV